MLNVIEKIVIKRVQQEFHFALNEHPSLKLKQSVCILKNHEVMLLVKLPTGFLN